MTEKVIETTNGWYLKNDTEKQSSYEIENFKQKLGQYNRGGLVKLLLEMKEENEQLKKEFHSCGHNWGLMYDEAKEKIEELDKENEQLKNRVMDLEELNKIYVNFLVNKGFELSDVLKNE